MDRSIVYAGAGAQDTDLLFAQRGAMVALGLLTELVVGNTQGSGPQGSGPVITGLAVQPVAGALQVQVGRGALFGWDAVDAAPYGTLGADAAHGLVHCAINLDPLTLPALAPPGVAGQAVSYLIEAQALSEDLAPMALPFWNAAAPSQPFLGPNNSGGTVATQRVRRVVAQARPGVAAAAGSQVAPPPDPGWVPLATVSVAAGQAASAASDILPHPLAPLLPFVLPQLTPGFSRRIALTASCGWTVPAGVTTVKVTVVGAGGGGSSGSNSQAGAGGGAGGMGLRVITGLVPGTVVPCVVGQGGAGGAPGGANGSAGGTTAFGTDLSATSGQPGSFGGNYAAGGEGGSASGGVENYGGSYGLDAILNGNNYGGGGAAGPFGGGGRAAADNQQGGSGVAPGAGGGGSYGPSPGAGGNGFQGIIILEY